MRLDLKCAKSFVLINSVIFFLFFHLSCVWILSVQKAGRRYCLWKTNQRTTENKNLNPIIIGWTRYFKIEVSSWRFIFPSLRPKRDLGSWWQRMKCWRVTCGWRTKMKWWGRQRDGWLTSWLVGSITRPAWCCVPARALHVSVFTLCCIRQTRPLFIIFFVGDFLL